LIFRFDVEKENFLKFNEKEKIDLQNAESSAACSIENNNKKFKNILISALFSHGKTIWIGTSTGDILVYELNFHQNSEKTQENKSTKDESENPNELSAAESETNRANIPSWSILGTDQNIYEIRPKMRSRVSEMPVTWIQNTRYFLIRNSHSSAAPS